MEIKVIRNFEGGLVIPINQELVLQIVDEEQRLYNYTAKKLYILNTSTSERYEIAPEIEKYFLADISYASYERDYIVFTSAKANGRQDIDLVFYQYRLKEDSVSQIYTTTVRRDELNSLVYLKAFVLDDNFILFQRSERTFENGREKFRQVLYDIRSETEKEVTIPQLLESGIYNILPLNGNLCAIKLGRPYIREMKHQGKKAGYYSRELVGLINIKQFISEISMDMEGNFLEILEESTDSITFPYIHNQGSHLVYSRYDTEKNIAEVILYETETKVKKVRVNKAVSTVSDIWRTFVVQDVPYLLRIGERHTRIVNLNTQKTEYRVDSSMKVRFVGEDLLVVSHYTHRFFLNRDKKEYVEAYRFPEIHRNPLVSIRGHFQSCLENGETLLIFTSEE